jgi:glycosidase
MDKEGDLERCHQALYQINTRVWMTELSRNLGRAATLDDIPDAELDRFVEMGFDWVWFLSVWQTGLAGQQISRSNPQWRKEFQTTLPDLREDDIAGSGFAITGYIVHRQLGGDAALARLRNRLRLRGLKLFLDFVPNHTALDHPWVEEHPEYFVHGSEEDLARAPQNYTRVKRKGGDLILAYGRDPYFPGWPDALQLNYSNSAVQNAMIGELLKVAGQCDGVRCDMAMLLQPDVFQGTWGTPSQPFWPQAIKSIRTRFPDFCFLAEVYWDMEWALQQVGFDYTYDKKLYDRLLEGSAQAVRAQLHAGLDYQNKMVRFLENHDEPRAAVVFPDDIHEAAAVITFLSLGLRFFHQGQFEGRTKRISVHLVRAPDEPINRRLQQFYERLLAVLRRLVVRTGQWQLLECARAWEDNGSSDCFIAFVWHNRAGERLLVTVNYSTHRSQCYVRLPFADLGEGQLKLSDLLGEANYDRDVQDLCSRGLYLDLAPWEYHVFELKKA